MRRLQATLFLLCLSIRLQAACPDSPTFNQRNYPGSSYPIVGFIRDVNHDGRADLAVFYNDGFGFQIFLGAPNGVLTPTPVQGITPSDDTYSALIAADVNGDGQTDVIAYGGNVHIFYGDGTGVFTPGPVLTVGCGGYLATGDFDGDGRLDIVAASVCGQVMVFRQTSPGAFAPPVDIPIRFPSDVAVADLDGDGHLDIAVTITAVDGSVEVATLFGAGDGQFTPATINLGAVFLQFADSVAIHDFNGDGKPDLAIGIVNRGVQILTNNGDRTFSLGALLAPEGGSVRVADFNYDGIADIFASGYGGFYIVPGNGDGTFRTAQFTAIPDLGICPNCFRRSYVVGDLRGLARVDVATTTAESQSQSIIVDLNNCGPPPVLKSITPASGPASGGNSVELDGADFFSPPQVLFGSTPAVITATTSNAVTVVAPAHAAAVVSVSISTADGTATLKDAYTFIGATTTTIQIAPVIAASRPFSVTALIAPAATAGSVTFRVDGIAIGTANVSNGVASVTTTAPATLGKHTISADFSGASIFGPSSASSTLNVAADVPMLSSALIALLAFALAACGATAIR